MSNQNFVTKLGFNRKGYDQIDASDTPSLVITGKSQNLDCKIVNLKKKIPNLHHIKIGSERFSITQIDKIIESIAEINFENVITFGGGSIIDISKRFFKSIKNTNQSSKLIVIPTLIGSGAESSMTSILNTKDKKIITSEEVQLPHTVIYDTEILKNIDSKEMVFGLIDSLTHCIESMTSFLTNPYLNFFSSSTVNYFFKNVDYKKIISGEFDDNEIYKLCIVSFNGGLAQNNAGAGICHALSHAAESITKIRHTRCINYFLNGTIDFIEKNNSEYFKKQGILELNNIRKIANLSKENIESINSLDKIIKNQSLSEELIMTAKKDPCWRLFNLKGKKDNILEYF